MELYHYKPSMRQCCLIEAAKTLLTDWVLAKRSKQNQRRAHQASGLQAI